jgi:hypothetical protein
MLCLPGFTILLWPVLEHGSRLDLEANANRSMSDLRIGVG